MKAILLAAGLGTRLRPLTKSIPKCLVPIKGRPLLEIWLESLVKFGISDILINTHYLSEKVETFIINSKFNENCIISFEEKLLGTAGTLINNLKFIGNDECMLIHADNYCLLNINDFMKAHIMRPSHCLMTMLTFRTDDPSSCGIVELDEKNVVTRFHEKEKDPPCNLANAAIYILSSDLIKLLKKKYFTVSDFSLDVLPKLLGKVYAYETRDLFIDIGTPNNYIKANLI